MNENSIVIVNIIALIYDRYGLVHSSQKNIMVYQFIITIYSLNSKLFNVPHSHVYALKDKYFKYFIYSINKLTSSITYIQK